MSAKVNKLTPADLARHRIMVGKYKEMQQLQAEVQAKSERIAKLSAAFEIWAEELMEKYKLDPTMGDNVEDDGRLIRVSGVTRNSPNGRK